MSAQCCLIGGMLLGLSLAAPCSAQDYRPSPSPSADDYSLENFKAQYDGWDNQGNARDGGQSYQSYKAAVKEHNDGLKWDKLIVVICFFAAVGVLRLVWAIVEAMRPQDESGRNP